VTAPTQQLNRLSSAWYEAATAEFASASPDAVLGRVVDNFPHAIEPDQAAAWHAEIPILQAALSGISGHVALEFDIPRMGARADAVVLTGPIVFVIEFKVGADAFDRAAIEQVWDYALDLKNFHRASHDPPVIPILIATNAATGHPRSFSAAADGVFDPLCVAPDELRSVLEQCLRRVSGRDLVAAEWLASPYHPTPTIIQAARTLYANHSVEAIARSDAGAINLRVTSRRIEELIAHAQRRREKLLVFLTGVPGAGKTLVGLNVATENRAHEGATAAVFLSGNGPLVAVLRAALIQDEKQRLRRAGGGGRGRNVSHSVKAFIQNVHHFRDAALRDIVQPPYEHVAIFDEAQRAWNQAKTADFMKRRKRQPDFTDSEPAFLIRYLDRHPDWAVVLCLVGGGQEIHTGEAGIGEWLTAAADRFPSWKLYISSRLTDSEYAAGHALERVQARGNAEFDDCLHLSVSMRSFRAENVSGFVKALLDRDARSAKELVGEILPKYPIRITRDLDAAKHWVRSQARGSERYGLLASSKALRLKPHAIDVRTEVDPVHWFLRDREDIRSSYFLEDCATEFQVQGLELDWTVVTWDADLRSSADEWSYHDFRGKKWQSVKADDRRLYLKNAYRVLLTRARQGMVIFVPPGSADDATRPPGFYNETYAYLEGVGIPALA
jgi:hypothetical protein